MALILPAFFSWFGIIQRTKFGFVFLNKQMLVNQSSNYIYQSFKRTSAIAFIRRFSRKLLTGFALCQVNHRIDHPNHGVSYHYYSFIPTQQFHPTNAVSCHPCQSCIKKCDNKRLLYGNIRASELTFHRMW